MMETCLGTPGTTWKVGYTLENHWTNWGTSTWQSNFDWRVATETMVIYGDLPVKYGDFPFEFPEGATVALWRSGANFDLGIHLFFRTPKNMCHLGFIIPTCDKVGHKSNKQAKNEPHPNQASVDIHLDPTSSSIHIHSYSCLYVHSHPFTSIYVHLRPCKACTSIHLPHDLSFETGNNWIVSKHILRWKWLVYVCLTVVPSPVHVKQPSRNHRF